MMNIRKSSILMCAMLLLLCVTNQSGYSQEQAIQQSKNRLIDKEIPSNLYGADFLSGQADAIRSRLRNTPVTGDYVIGQGDVFRIRFTGVSNEDFQVPVDNTGAVTFGNVAPIQLNGKTLAEAKELINERVQEVYRNVSITINLLELKTIDIVVHGYFSNPGIHVVPGNAQLVDLIALAGGLRGSGNFRAVEYTTALGEKIIVDLYQYFETGDIPKLYPLTGDRIYATPVAGSYTIFGSIYNSAIYQFNDPMTLQQAIQFAGGVTPNANIQHIHVSRKTSINDYDFYEIDLTQLQEDEFVLEHGDIIYIPTKNEILSETHVFVEIAGRVEKPGSYILPKGSRVNDLIEEAGGLREDGFRNGIALRRSSLQADESRIRTNFFQPIEQKLLELQSKIAESAVLEDEQTLMLKAQQFRRQLIESLGQTMESGRVLFNPNTDNPILDNQDRVIVPTIPNTVLVMGAVLMTGSPSYQPDWSLDDYLSHMGGVSILGNKDDIYLIKPYGFIQKAGQSQMEIEPGDIILVPPKFELFDLNASQSQN